MTTRISALLSLVAVALPVMATYACSSDDKGGGGKILDDGGPISVDDSGNGTGGKPSTGASRIGSACVRNADCGSTGLTCITSASTVFNGGGPANGYCAADCSTDASICQNLDANSVCVRFSDSSTSTSGPAYCLEGCTVGPSASATAKCHNRDDVACDDTGGSVAGDGFCRPVCRNNGDCDTDRVCDIGSGTCMDPADLKGTLPVGSPCDPTAATEKCKGVCVPLTQDDDTKGMCGGLCTLGAGGGCGAEDATPQAVCLFALTNASPDTGDLGLCGKLCNCDDECTAFGRACRPLSADEAAQVGFKGYCGGAKDPDTGELNEHLACTGKPDAGKPPVTDSGAPVVDSGTPVKDAAAD